MTAPPVFPVFEPVRLSDREIIQDRLSRYRPETSELTFTNLYIWQPYFGLKWSLLDDCLVILSQKNEREFFFPPVGNHNRASLVGDLFQWQKKRGKVPRIERADERLVRELSGAPFEISQVRNYFDYLYRTRDLMTLEGRRYHAKRNHINKIQRTMSFTYEPITAGEIRECMKALKKWCDHRKCRENPVMKAECKAVHKALFNFESLQLTGGLVRVSGAVAAFSLGEMLNEDTAVIHVEKADPEIPQMFTVMNQQFCEHAWSQTAFINREQDVGEPGLRKAKESYFPFRLVEKYSIQEIREGNPS